MILLFDAGGVLIELGPPPVDTAWLPADKTLDELWADWLHMDVSRRFESGALTDQEFARELIESLGLQTSVSVFLKKFEAWPLAPFAGTVEWLKQLSSTYETAMLSNTNELHWRRMKDEMGLGDVLHHYFLSHKLGLVKPDADIFEKVLQQLDASAEQVVFFDDNKANIDAALAIGMQARHVVGPEQVRQAVASLND